MVKTARTMPLSTVLALVASVLIGAAARAESAEIEAFLTKCSQEADEKGLDVKKGKGAERKAYRRECMRKFGVEPK